MYDHIKCIGLEANHHYTIADQAVSTRVTNANYINQIASSFTIIIFFLLVFAIVIVKSNQIRKAILCLTTVGMIGLILIFGRFPYMTWFVMIMLVIAETINYHQLNMLKKVYVKRRSFF